MRTGEAREDAGTCNEWVRADCCQESPPGDGSCDRSERLLTLRVPSSSPRTMGILATRCLVCTYTSSDPLTRLSTRTFAKHYDVSGDPVSRLCALDEYDSWLRIPVLLLGTAPRAVHGAAADHRYSTYGRVHVAGTPCLREVAGWLEHKKVRDGSNRRNRPRRSNRPKRSNRPRRQSQRQDRSARMVYPRG